MAAKRRRRRRALKLTKLGRALVLVLIAVITGSFALAIVLTKDTKPDYTVSGGSGSPIAEIVSASAESTPVPTPTPTPVPSPTPTIRLIVTPAPENAAEASPTPTFALESRYPTQQEIANAYDTVLSNGGVNLRAGCSENSKVLAEKLKRGAKVRVYAREGDFFFLQLMSTGQYGYISCKFVDAPDYTPVPVATQVPEGAVGGEITSKTLMLRNGPGTDYTGIYDYTKGTLLYVYFLTNGDWYYVEVPSTGAKGYMNKNYIKVDAEPPSGTPVP